MNEALKQLFSSFGAIGLGIITISAAFVWALAHFSAKPGTAVSVLWGLFSYTKPEQQIKLADTQIKHLPAQRKDYMDEEELQEFKIGSALRVMIDDSAEVPDGSKYIRISQYWIDGVSNALEPLTTVQKENELKKLVGEARAIIEGDVWEVDSGAIMINSQPGRLAIMFDESDEDTRQLIQSFHKDDRIRLHAEFTTRGLWLLRNPTKIQRVTRRRT